MLRLYYDPTSGSPDWVILTYSLIALASLGSNVSVVCLYFSLMPISPSWVISTPFFAALASLGIYVYVGSSVLWSNVVPFPWSYFLSS